MSPLSRQREPQVTSFSFLSAFEAFMAGAREPIHLRLTLMPLVVHPRNLPFVHDIAIPSRHQETRYLLEMHVHEEDVQSYICNKIYQSNTEKERVSNQMQHTVCKLINQRYAGHRRQTNKVALCKFGRDRGHHKVSSLQKVYKFNRHISSSSAS